jgi:hypothetical protein
LDDANLAQKGPRKPGRTFSHTGTQIGRKKTLQYLLHHV